MERERDHVAHFRERGRGMREEWWGWRGSGTMGVGWWWTVLGEGRGDREGVVSRRRTHAMVAPQHVTTADLQDRWSPGDAPHNKQHKYCW